MSLYSAMLNVKRVSSLLSHLDALGGSEAEHPEDERVVVPLARGEIREIRLGSAGSGILRFPHGFILLAALLERHRSAPAHDSRDRS